MFFQKKINATMDWLKSKNPKEYVETEELDSQVKWKGEEDHAYLDKKDMFALYLSALLVFSPVFIVLLLILIWSFKVF